MRAAKPSTLPGLGKVSSADRLADDGSVRREQSDVVNRSTGHEDAGHEEITARSSVETLDTDSAEETARSSVETLNGVETLDTDSAEETARSSVDTYRDDNDSTQIAARSKLAGSDEDSAQTKVVRPEERLGWLRPASPTDRSSSGHIGNATSARSADLPVDSLVPEHHTNPPTAALLALVETALADDSDSQASDGSVPVLSPDAREPESSIVRTALEAKGTDELLDELLSDDEASPDLVSEDELLTSTLSVEELSALAPAAEDLTPLPPAAADVPSPGPVNPTATPTSVAEAESATPSATSVGPSQPPRFSLDGVLALDALSDEQRDELTSLAKIEQLELDQEICPSGLILLLEGTAALQARISDVPAVRLRPGDVVFPEGSLPDALEIRIVATSTPTRLAVWDRDTILDSLGRCPGLLDELRQASDRMQALAGCSMGTIGDRLDEDLRAIALERLEARVLEPHEVLVRRRQPVPGLIVVGVGSLELDDENGSRDRLGPGDFLFADEVLGGGQAPANVQAGPKGCVILFGARRLAHELMVTCPPLLEIFAGM